MPQGKIVQEVPDEQVLHLAGKRHGLVSQSERIGHTRHILVEILFHCAHRKDMAERLFRMFGQFVRSTLQIFHVIR